MPYAPDRSTESSNQIPLPNPPIKPSGSNSFLLSFISAKQVKTQIQSYSRIMELNVKWFHVLFQLHPYLDENPDDFFVEFQLHPGSFFAGDFKSTAQKTSKTIPGVEFVYLPRKKESICSALLCHQQGRRS
jgi:hypothetical protein